jgi:hypothetical protein
MRSLLLPLVTSLLALPAPATAVAPPFGFALEGVLFRPSGPPAPGLTAVASWWVTGGLQAEARLGFWSADRPEVRAAAAITPALGLRWGPWSGPWQPLVGVEVGVRLPADGPSVRPTGAVRGGLEWFWRRDLSASAGLAWRWSTGERPGADLRLGLAWYP